MKLIAIIYSCCKIICKNLCRLYNMFLFKFEWRNLFTQAAIQPHKIQVKVKTCTPISYKF